MVILMIIAWFAAGVAFLQLSGFWMYVWGIAASLLAINLTSRTIAIFNRGRELRNQLEKLKYDLGNEIAGLWDRFIKIKAICECYDFRDRRDIKAITKMVMKDFRVIIRGCGWGWLTRVEVDPYPPLIIPPQARDRFTVDDFKELYQPVLSCIHQYNATLKELKDMASNIYNLGLVQSHPFAPLDDQYFQREYQRIEKARR